MKTTESNLKHEKRVCDIYFISMLQTLKNSVFDVWWLTILDLRFPCRFLLRYKSCLDYFVLYKDEKMQRRLNSFCTWCVIWCSRLFWTQLHGLVFQMDQVTQFKCIPPQEARWVGSQCVLHLLLLSPLSRYCTCPPVPIHFKYGLPVSGTVSDHSDLLLETLAHKATVKVTGEKN